MPKRPNIKRRTIKDVGQMCHRITFKRYVPSDAGAGGQYRGWSTLFTRWAAVDDWIGEAEEERAGHIETRIRKVFSVHYSDQINTTMRIVYQNVWYKIQSMIDVGESHNMLDIYAIGIPAES